MSKGIFLLGFGLILVALAFAATDGILRASDPITRENCKWIDTHWMQPAEVARFLGRPADSARRPLLYGPGFGTSVVLIQRWKGPRGCIDVRFIQFDGKLVGFRANFFEDSRSHILQNLRSRLGW